MGENWQKDILSGTTLLTAIDSEGFQLLNALKLHNEKNEARWR